MWDAGEAMEQRGSQDSPEDGQCGVHAEVDLLLVGVRVAAQLCGPQDDGRGFEGVQSENKR